MRVVFSGNAVGAAGRIDRPERLVMPVQASCSLPVIGGQETSSVGFRSFGPYFRFDSLETSATGTSGKKPGSMSTRVYACAKGIVVADRLRLGMIEASLHSQATDTGEPWITPRAAIAGLSLDDFPVEVELDVTAFEHCATKAALDQSLRKDKAFAKQFGAQFAKTREPADTEATTSEWRGTRLASVVKSIGTDNPNAQVSGNMIYLRNYGRIYLGEILIDDSRRRLTMLRIQLGSPQGGEFCSVGVESNGMMIP